MVDEGYDFTLIAEKLNRTALATRGKYERLQNPEYNKRYNRGQNEDYEYQGIRSIRHGRRAAIQIAGAKIA